MPPMPMMTMTSLALAMTVAFLAAPHSAYAFMNMNQPCDGFSCRSAKYQAVPREDFTFTANGCGTKAMKISTAIDFSECCNWHDACYSTCGMKKSYCEKRLTKCMNDKCAAVADADERKDCESTTQLFSLGTQLVACPAYQAAQRDACRCVPKDKATAAFRARVVHFLTENKAPESELAPDAVDALLKKYEGKEAKMFLRLLIKYPDAIVIDPEREHFMDNIFGSKPDDLEEVQKPSNVEVDEHIEL